MKKVSLLKLCLVTLLLGATQIKAEILTTTNYIITITHNCDEGEVGCDDVTYVGVNRKSKKTISLKGADLMHYCPSDLGDGPGKTPCRHIGYEFKNDKVNYFVGDEGNLEVTRGAKVLLREKGVWSKGNPL